MISVQISYTVKPDFALQNKKNISAFLLDFKKLSDASFLYNVYLKEDGLTFLHVSMFENEDVQARVLNVPSFLEFQRKRDESGVDGSHKVEFMNLIGSSLGLI